MHPNNGFEIYTFQIPSESTYMNRAQVLFVLLLEGTKRIGFTYKLNGPSWFGFVLNVLSR